MTTINKKAPRARFTAACFGRGWIGGEDSGIVNINGIPARREIVLFEQRTMLLIRSTWSDAQGNYRFNYLDPNKHYVIVAIDHMGQYDLVGHSHILPYTPTD